jgi:hypothetical protein
MNIPNGEIVCGNHESIPINKSCCGMIPEEKELLEDPKFAESIRQAYALFPSSILVSCSDPSPIKETLLFTHGAFEIDYDYSKFSEMNASMFFIPQKKVELTPEIQVLLRELPPDWNKPNVDVYDYVRTYLEEKQIPSERIEMICSALRLHLFLHSPVYPSDHPIEFSPPFSGDLSSITMQEGLQRKRDLGMHMTQWARIRPALDCDCLTGSGLFLSLKTVRAFMCLQKNAKFSLNGFIKGHEHVEEDFGNRVNGYTLPASSSEAIFMPATTTPSQGGGTPPVSIEHKDGLLVIEITGPEIAKWNASMYRRAQNEDVFTRGPCNISWMHSV